MHLIAVGAKRSVTGGIVLLAIAALSIHPVTALRAQARDSGARRTIRLPQESAGIDAIATALMGAFDQVDLVALGEAHERRIDSDLRIALVRHPGFAKKVRSIVIECGSSVEQATLDRYIRGEDVSPAQLERVWKSTRNGDGFCNAPMYTEFLAAVRGVNVARPAEARIRIFGGESEPGNSGGPAEVLKNQVLKKREKALVIYGSAHFYLAAPPDYVASMGGPVSFAQRLEAEYPGRTLTVIPIGALARPSAVKAADVEPDYQKFDRALETTARPVLVSLQRSPFKDFTAEEFLGRTLTTCRGPEGCRSVFKGSTLSLGQIADACVYVGRNADLGRQGRPARFE
jgi:hypothetical protein